MTDPEISRVEIFFLLLSSRPGQLLPVNIASLFFSFRESATSTSLFPPIIGIENNRGPCLSNRVTVKRTTEAAMRKRVFPVEVSDPQTSRKKKKTFELSVGFAFRA